RPRTPDHRGIPPRTIVRTTWDGHSGTRVSWAAHRYGSAEAPATCTSTARSMALTEAVIDAVVLDVGGVFLIPHPESVGAALAAHGIQIDPALIERAHYTGVGALDACDGPDQTHPCYL